MPVAKKPRKQRPNYDEKLKPYRIDKHRPRRPTITFREDLGNFERVKTISFPSDVYEKETIIPKNPNPNILSVLKSPIRIVFYKDTGKCFVYDLDKNYIGNLEKHDLKRVFSFLGRSILPLFKKTRNFASTESKKED